MSTPPSTRALIRHLGLTPHREGGYGLVSEAVSPGFDDADMQLGSRAALHALFPQHGALIDAFTPVP